LALKEIQDKDYSMNGCYFGGCDVGSTTGKAVLLKDGNIISHSIVKSTTKPELTARIAMDEAIKKAGLTSTNDLKFIVGTGYGRLRIPFADENISEITCHARGAKWLCPSVGTVIDIGGQDCKVMSLDERGKVKEFVMNDKCASGTGRLFEAMTRVLSCDLDEFSCLSLKSIKPATITSQCSVFAESEVITLINEGVDLSEICAGINESIAIRLIAMVRRIGFTGDLTVTGGCAKNAGLIHALEKRDVSVKRLSVDTQIVGAIGASLIAVEKAAVKEQQLKTEAT
jgi:predicted CoA-substrate-specific enzyme activase